MDVLFPNAPQKRSDGKAWEVQMPPWNVTLCPVTLNTLTSILQTRDDHLTQGKIAMRSLSAHDRKSRLDALVCHQAALLEA